MTERKLIKYDLQNDNQLYQNGVLIDEGQLMMNSFKIYPNPYLVIIPGSIYTKHYYAGSQRVASRLLPGSENFEDQSRGSNKQSSKEEVDVEGDFYRYVKKAGLETSKLDGEYSRSLSSVADIYYYHGDHLGSSTYITDSHAVTTQFFLNLPFAETMLEQMTGVYDNPYKFNAKELDSETGLYYYGARYYNPRLSIWLSVDPLAEEFPSWSPYNYTLNNPINLVDPDGMAAEHIDVIKNKDGSYKVVGGKANSDKNIYVVNENGKRTGDVVGQMLTEYSFHNEDGSAVKGATINLNDQSGQNFINNEIRNVGFFYYLGNAKGNEPLDFKNRGINDRDKNTTVAQYHYRGMSFNGKVASARDIGNYGAGYVAGSHGLGWSTSRFGFDALQTKQEKGFWNTFLYYPFNRVNEGQPTQRAEREGHTAGKRDIDISQKFKNALTVPSHFINPIRMR